MLRYLLLPALLLVGAASAEAGPETYQPTLPVQAQQPLQQPQQLQLQVPAQPQQPGSPPSVQPVQPAVPAVPATPSNPPTGQPEPRVKLYYRELAHLPWKYVGCFECVHDAKDYAKPLETAGYETYFRNCR